MTEDARQARASTTLRGARHERSPAARARPRGGGGHVARGFAGRRTGDHIGGYGRSYYDGVNPPDNYPSGAAWYVYFAQSTKAATAGARFSQVAATPIVHFGGVCEGGISCTGNRDLFDDFGVAANPLTGLASIVYSDDQYTNDPNDPPGSSCTPSRSNSGSCDHTAIATQTGGSGIK